MSSRRRFNFIEDANKHIPWSEFKKGLNTGDLILCQGKGFFSSLVQISTQSIYSHIMFVIKSPLLSKKYPDYKDSDDIYFLHSSYHNLGIDVILKKYKTGVHIVRSDEAICRYIYDDGKLFIRKSPKVLKNVEIHIDPLEKPWFEEWLVETVKKPYEKNVKELASSALDCFNMPWFENKTEDDSSYFCSELIAKLMQILYNFNSKVQRNEKTPSDFSYYYMHYSYEIQFEELDEWGIDEKIRLTKEELTVLCNKYLNKWN